MSPYIKIIDLGRGNENEHAPFSTLNRHPGAPSNREVRFMSSKQASAIGYSGVALNGSITRPKSLGDRAYHERRLTTREIAFGAMSRRRRRRHSAADRAALVRSRSPSHSV
jgi:hypothetical protein